jgi:hypothetical protein
VPRKAWLVIASKAVSSTITQPCAAMSCITRLDVRIDGDGLPTFYPPAWIDPDRGPGRNHRLKPHTPSAGDHVGVQSSAPCCPTEGD